MNYKEKILELKRQLAQARDELRKQQAAAEAAARLCEALRKGKEK